MPRTCRWCGRPARALTDRRTQKCDACRRVRVCARCRGVKKGSEMARPDVCCACYVAAEPPHFWDLGDVLC